MGPSGIGPSGIMQLQDMVIRVLGLAVSLGFVALTVMLVIGGIKYLTSGGEPKAVSSAQQTITWALLGMLFFAIAFVALRIVGSLTGYGGDITKICLKFDC